MANNSSLQDTQVHTDRRATDSGPFLKWLDGWVDGLTPLDLSEFMRERTLKPDNIAVISADLVVGFCYNGTLASPRIAGVVEPSAELFRRAYSLGVEKFVLVQEYHSPDAVEFHQFAPHCIRGTEEAQTVASLADLPFSDQYKVIHKNSLHPALDTDMDAWLAEHPEINTFITVGDCTDLCLYQLVMHLKLGANAVNRHVEVIVPANCVQTYDLSVEIAEGVGAMPHDGDLIHAVFLYHMALNGAQVVAEVR